MPCFYMDLRRAHVPNCKREIQVSGALIRSRDQDSGTTFLDSDGMVGICISARAATCRFKLQERLRRATRTRMPRGQMETCSGAEMAAFQARFSGGLEETGYLGEILFVQ